MGLLSSNKKKYHKHRKKALEAKDPDKKRKETKKMNKYARKAQKR